MATIQSGDRFHRLPEVMARTGLKRDCIYRKIRSRDFPAPVKLTERASGWLSSEIDAWLASRLAQRSRDAA